MGVAYFAMVFSGLRTILEVAAYVLVILCAIKYLKDR